MELLGKTKLIKLKKKNTGNKALCEAIDKLIKDLEEAKWKTKKELQDDRPDADCVNSEGAYIFDIKIHRTLVFIVFSEGNGEDVTEGEATVLWAGPHDEYDKKFNNKSTIESYLRINGIIE